MPHMINLLSFPYHEQQIPEKIYVYTDPTALATADIIAAPFGCRCWCWCKRGNGGGSCCRGVRGYKRRHSCRLGRRHGGWRRCRLNTWFQRRNGRGREWFSLCGECGQAAHQCGDFVLCCGQCNCGECGQGSMCGSPSPRRARVPLPHPS